MAHSSLLTALLIAAAVGLGQAASQNAPGTQSASTVFQGDSAAGKALFDGPGNCSSCHRVGAVGSVLGPNLSDVASRFSPAGLRQLLVKPPAKIDPAYRLYQVVLRNGKTVQGKLLNQDPFSVQMLDSGANLIAFPRSEVREGHPVDPPPMPSYEGKLTTPQIDDLVAYLSSLRTPQN